MIYELEDENKIILKFDLYFFGALYLRGSKCRFLFSEHSGVFESFLQLQYLGDSWMACFVTP